MFGGTQSWWGSSVRCACMVALVLAASAPSRIARAQDATLHGGGMDLHLFRPAVDTRGYFTVNGTEVMPHKEFSFGLVLDAGFGLLRYNGFDNNPNAAAADAGRETRISKQAFTGTFMFNFGLIDRLVIGIQLPITFFRGNSVQTPDRSGSCLAGSSTCLYNLQGNGLRSQGVGDLTIHAKARLLNLGESPIGIAATLRVGFPTAKTTQFAGNPASLCGLPRSWSFSRSRRFDSLSRAGTGGTPSRGRASSGTVARSRTLSTPPGTRSMPSAIPTQAVALPTTT